MLLFFSCNRFEPHFGSTLQINTHRHNLHTRPMMFLKNLDNFIPNTIKTSKQPTFDHAKSMMYTTISLNWECQSGLVLRKLVGNIDRETVLIYCQ